jgi:hypothetical protein
MEGKISATGMAHQMLHVKESERPQLVKISLGIEQRNNL